MKNLSGLMNFVVSSSTLSISSVKEVRIVNFFLFEIINSFPIKFNSKTC